VERKAVARRRILTARWKPFPYVLRACYQKKKRDREIETAKRQQEVPLLLCCLRSAPSRLQLPICRQPFLYAENSARLMFY
jgi:hypothetical protein